MNKIILLLAFLMTVLYACKKKIPNDAVVNKMAGRHEWTGTELIIDNKNHSTSLNDIKFSTVIYALNKDAIMYYDSVDSRMITLTFTSHDLNDKVVSFEENKFSAYNIIKYYYLQDSFFWVRHFISNKVYGDEKWRLHSP